MQVVCTSWAVICKVTAAASDFSFPGQVKGCLGMVTVFYQPARAFHNGMQVVFVHKPSGTLIATDLIWNYPGSGTPKGTQAWKFGMDRVYLPFYKTFMIKDKGKYHIPPPTMCVQQLITPASSLYLELALLASVSSKADGHFVCYASV